jgi:hypothetical protein
MPSQFEHFTAELTDARALVAAGRINLTSLRAAADDPLLSDEALMIGQMLQSDDYGMDDVIARAGLVQNYADGLITLGELNDRLEQLDLAFEDDTADPGDLIDP